jgi:RNA polymerase sigma-70 factor (ECF subfamily)
LERFRGDASFATWLYRIALNESRIYLRREKRRAQGLVQLAERQPCAAPDDLADSELMLLLQELPEKQRMALALFYLQELSLAEIAAAMGAPLGTVKALIFRGRTKLRELALERKLL